MPTPIKYQLIYFAIISLISLTITIYDKIAAKIAPRRRIQEKTLLIFGGLGGALVMYITMQLIRHKTRKKKFMAGLPVMIALHAAAVFGLNYWLEAGIK